METVQSGNWVGVDWGDREHTVSVVDAAGAEVARFRVRHSAEGLTGLPAQLRAYGPVAGVAVETPRHLLVHVLVEAAMPVYAINPRQSHTWRKCLAVSGAKDDGKDAWALADGLRHYHRHLQRYVRDAADPRKLGRLCEGEMRLTQARTRLVQQLTAGIKQYFPAALEFISDWTTQMAWDFLLQFPTARAFASASTAKLVGFLRQHRQGLTPQWRARIAARQQATQWPCDAAVEAAEALLATSLAKQLRTLQVTLKEYRNQIMSLYNDNPDKAIFESLPGAGPKLAVRLACEFGSLRERFDAAAGVQKMAGTAPVTFQSGGHREVRIRRACQKRFRTTLHQFAQQSIKRCAWARACYRHARGKGQPHATALRFVANKWLKIIYRMWQDHKPYDEAQYLEQLKRHNSPIAYELGLLKSRG